MRLASYLKFGGCVVVVSALVTAAAPQHTSTTLRVAVFLLVAAAAVGLVDMTRRRLPAAEKSPFEPRRGSLAKPGVPADLVRLALEVRAFSVASQGGHTPTVVPGALRRAMRAVASSRLALHHGLRLNEPADATSCSRVCGAPLWAALDGEPVAADADRLITILEQL